MGASDYPVTTTTDKTYAELKQDAADRWQKNSAAHIAKMQTTQEQIANSPDVRDAPLLGSTWNNELVVCGCGSTLYTMRRWACINGLKHRTEVECLACHTVKTWDFQESRWTN